MQVEAGHSKDVRSEGDVRVGVTDDTDYALGYVHSMLVQVVTEHRGGVHKGG